MEVRPFVLKRYIVKYENRFRLSFNLSISVSDRVLTWKYLFRPTINWASILKLTLMSIAIMEAQITPYRLMHPDIKYNIDISSKCVMSSPLASIG